jgi:hypothetical protein
MIIKRGFHTLNIFSTQMVFHVLKNLMINLLPTVVCFHFSEPLGSLTGKCSHGGPDDESRTSVARCGINKDSVSVKWSPHHYLHKQAYAENSDAPEG